MKKLFFALSTAILIQACTSPDVSTDKTTTPEFSGKAFALSDSIDSRCQSIPLGTDSNWPTYMFVNDSVFIKTISNCCSPSTISHYSGTYKIEADKLILSYDSIQVVYSIEEAVDSQGQVKDSSITQVQIEPSDLKLNTMKVFYCKNAPYFREVNEPWEDKIIASTGQPLSKYFDEMKEINVWKKINRTK